MTRLLLIASLAATLASTLPAAGATEPAPDAPDDRAKVTFDLVARATPHGVRLGLRYRIAPGWHIYWENPGDSGMATSADVEVPDAWSAGPLQFPGPDSFGGELVSYGYSGEVTLFVDLERPDGAAGEVRVASRWLVCREICEPESDEAALTLGKLAAAPLPGEARLPRPLPDADGVAVRVDDTSLTIEVADASAATLFPTLELEAAFGGNRPSFLREENAKGGARTVLRANLPGDRATALRGVLRIERDGRPAWYDLTIPATGAPR